MSPLKASFCPRCGAEGVKIGETPLPDGNGAYELYQCLFCGHGFSVADGGVA